MLDTTARHIAPAPRRPSSCRRARIVLLQTQAEAAGAQEISRILGLGLASRGFDVHHVFCFRRTAAFDDQPDTFFCSRERPTSLLALARMGATLVHHLKELQPDAVLCFQHYGNVIGTLAARVAGAGMIVVNRNTARSLVPWWLHGVELAFGLVGWFQAMVVNSGAVEAEYDRYPGRYRKRLVRIDHGFEPRTRTLSRADARRSFALPADGVVLGCVSRLHPGKNLQAAIRLLAGRDWHLALAGQGPARDDLIGVARSLGVLDRLHLVGELPADRIGDFLGALDVFVFPSTAETFGLAAVEAAQAGVPVVANDLGVLREVLAIDGEPCALFADAETPAFGESVRRIVEDPALRTRMSSRAARLAARYSLDAMVDGYVSLIDAGLTRRLPA